MTITCHRSGGRRQRRVAATAATLGLVLAVQVGVTTAPASADPSLTPTRGAPWFGVQPAGDASGAAAASELGGNLALLARSYTYPLDDAATADLAEQSAESAAMGAASVVTLLPEDLVASSTQDAESLASMLADLAEADGSFFLVRFGPEMNGSWNSWSRLPRTYINQFRSVADAVHDATDEAAMVWAPAYGGGYPFTASGGLPAGATAITAEPAPSITPQNLTFLDTDDDGAVTGSDDPYQPYFPGGDYIDWVGLTIAPDAQAAASGRGRGGLPAMDDYFLEQVGYATSGPRSTFYVRYAGPPGRPMLLTTGLPNRDGGNGGDPADSGVAQVWLDQIVQAGDTRPLLGGVVWLDDGELTEDSQDSADTLTASDLDLGPVSGDGGSGSEAAGSDSAGSEDAGAPSSAASSSTDGDLRDPNATGAAASDGLDGGSFSLGVLTTLVLGAGAAVVWLRVRRRRAVPPWLR